MAGAGKDIELNNIFDLYTKVRKDSELTVDQLQGRFLQTIDELIYTGFLGKSKRKGKKGEFWAEKRFFGHSTFTN